VDSLAIQIETSALRNILVDAGHTKLVDLKLGHEHAHRTVMIREVQIDNYRGKLLHVDFYQLNLKENIRVNIPITLIGESAAAKMKGNSLVQELNELTVLCLPTNIPSKLEVDISPLVTPDQMIRVKDLTAMPDVQVINEPGVVVARIAVEVAEVEKAKIPTGAEAASAADAAAAEGEKKEAAPAKGEKAPLKVRSPLNRNCGLINDSHWLSAS